MTHIPVCASLGNDDRPHRALVLPGGGMRLSYQAGAVRALLESGLRFDHVDGTSGGSLNLSMLFSGQDIYEMCERWRALNLMDTIGLAPLGDYLDFANVKAAAGTDNMRDKVLPALGIDIECIHEAEGLTGAYNVFDYASKEVVVVEHTDIDPDLLVAGMALPGVLPPLERDGRIFLDTGFVQDANLLDCVRRGCSEIWVVWGLGNTSAYRGGLLRLYVQMLEMSANSAIIREAATIAKINRRIEAGESVDGHRRPIRVHVVKPRFPLPLDPDVYQGRIDSGTLIDMGFSDARTYLAAASALGVPLDATITRQSALQPGVAFRLRFFGRFQLGTSDPAVGEERGEDMTLAVAVRVLGLEDFITDDSRPAELFARVSHVAFGRERPGYDGECRMFTAGERANERRIVYSLRFDLGDKPHCLQAWQELRDDPGFDMLADLRTLYVQLHQGKDTSGVVTGAGVLRVDAEAMNGFNASLCPIEGASPIEDAALLARFARYYLGRLSDVYFQAGLGRLGFW